MAAGGRSLRAPLARSGPSGRRTRARLAQLARGAARVLGALGRAAVLLLALIGALTVGLVVYVVRSEQLVEFEALDRRTVLSSLPVRSEVLARDGSFLAHLHGGEERALVRLDDVPEVAVDALVATEDKRFFEHAGVDPVAIARAAVRNASMGRVVEGGSSITQQLVKNRIVGVDRDLPRKAREAVLALVLEARMTKEEILTEYLNTVYFGNDAYGIAVAAERYFAKPVAALELHEAALLAGMIAAPGRYDPVRFPDRARERRTEVLQRMADERYLTPVEALAAVLAPLPTSVTYSSVAGESHHFVEEVRRRLLADPRLGKRTDLRAGRVQEGGLRIHTTLDLAAQHAAVAAVRHHLPPGGLTAALVAVEPRTGQVRAYVGGGPPDGHDVVSQGRRQPGSSFKPVVLAAALEAGLSPEDVVDSSSPCVLELPDRPAWVVDNYDGDSPGRLTLRDATAVSSNCAFARLTLALGVDKVVEMAVRLGITTPLDRVPAIGLGAGSVSPLEMATVYATFAADGLRHDPLFVTHVEDGDGKLLEAAPAGRPVLDPERARILTSVLGEVVTRGTGRAAALDRPTAGKTGTSQEWHDAWFGGYVPQLAAVVWMGSVEAATTMRDADGSNITGGRHPARIWSMFMRDALAAVAAEPFPPPDPAKQPAPGRSPLAAQLRN